MAVAVRWLKDAEHELDDIWFYIASDSPANAANLMVKLLQATRDLGEYPRSGHVVQEFGRDEIREYPVWPYRIVYRLASESITILAIVHGAQQMPGDIPDRT